MGTVRRTLKADARAALKGRTGAAAAVTFILMLTAFALMLAEAVVPLLLNIPAFLQHAAQAENLWETVGATAPWYLLAALVAGLLNLVFTAPLTVGSCDWYMDATYGEKQETGHIFWPFGCRRFWGSMVQRLLSGLLSVFWLLLFLALPAAGLGCALYSLSSFTFEAVAYTLLLTGALAAALLVPVMLVLLGIFLSWLELVPYLMGHRRNMGPVKALRTAARITRGHRFETFALQLSFLPWMLLCLFVLPALFVLPYRSMTMAFYTRYLLELEENRKNPPAPLPPETPFLSEAFEEPAADAFADAEPLPATEEEETAPSAAQEEDPALPREETPEKEPPALPQSWQD